MLSALLSDEFGPRVAVLAIVVPSTIIGGFLILRSARFIRNDLSLVVAELREEMEEHTRQVEAPDDDPGAPGRRTSTTRTGRCRCSSTSGFEVRRGEVLALLGTNGAGKSTILRVIAGLGTPARGVVRLNGRNITYTTPEQRARLGIRILLGGKGVFPAMTVQENLEMAAFVYRRDDADFQRRLDRAYDLFPALAEKRRGAASTLSGGQQQMLALAMMLLHDPEVLAIDELSLGLAPLLVQELLGVIERLKARGDDDHHRRAVAERGALGRRSCGVPREGRRCASAVRPPSSPSATTSRAPCSSEPKAADRGRGRRPGSPSSSSSTASSRAC